MDADGYGSTSLNLYTGVMGRQRDHSCPPCRISSPAGTPRPPHHPSINTDWRISGLVGQDPSPHGSVSTWVTVADVSLQLTKSFAVLKPQKNLTLRQQTRRVCCRDMFYECNTL
jgi:hypothetical protein